MVTIEPIGGGGDLQIGPENRKVIVQNKARTNNRPWGLGEVFQHVIPDLYRAVPADLSTDYKYQFVTEGRRGNWDNALFFFQHKLGRVVPRDPLLALDDTREERFSPNHRYTPRKFLESVVAEIRKGAGKDEPETLVAQKLWHLLGRFEFIGDTTAELLEARLRLLLLGLVANPSNVDGKLGELVFSVLRRGAEGGNSFAPSELLDEVNLDAQPLADALINRTRATDHLESILELRDHKIDLSVRPPIVWSRAKSVLILSGESGQGKSWQLASLAKLGIERPGCFFVWVSARGDGDADIQEARRSLWEDILHRDVQPLERLCEWGKRLGLGAYNPEVTVVIDDVTSVREGRRLIERTLNKVGVRLAMSTSPEIAEVLSSGLDDEIEQIRVSDFSDTELHAYLSRRGFEWYAIPEDLRETLRRPLLASLFCRTSQDIDYTPTVEYEIIESHWRRIGREKDGDQLLETSDLARSIAFRVTDPNAGYPWSQNELTERGLRSPHVLHLMRVGWLSRDGKAGFAIPHNRLLNWAVAEEIRSRCRSGKIVPQDLYKVISNAEKLRGRRRLRYLSMDVLWLLCDPDFSLLEHASALIESMEGHHPDPFYERSIPTLGPRAIPLIDARLRQSDTGEWSQIPRVAGESLRRIAERSPAPVREVILKYIASESGHYQRVGLRVLQTAPDGRALDIIWSILGRVKVALRTKEDGGLEYEIYRAATAACRACIRVRTDWLEQRILTCDPDDPAFWELPHLLASLPGPDAKEIWTRVKSRLKAQATANDRVGIARCIRRFVDVTERDFLISMLSSESSFTVGTALSALSRIAPHSALEQLQLIEIKSLVHSSNLWIHDLLLSEGERFTEHMCALLAKSEPDSLYVGMAWTPRPNKIGLDSVDVLLRWLPTELEAAMSVEGKEASRPALHWILQSLEKAVDSRIIARLQELAGTRTEELLAQFVLRQTSSGALPMIHFDEARALLLRIGGPQVCQVANKHIASPGHFARLSGLAWCLFDPDQETKFLLRRLALSPESEDKPESYHRYKAVEKLSTLGDKRTVAESVLNFGSGCNDGNCDRLSLHAPMEDDLLSSALVALRESDGEALIPPLLVLGLSHRSDHVLDVHAAMERAADEDRVIMVGLRVLRMLKARDVTSLRLAAERLGSERSRDAANLLLADGSEESLQVLRDHVTRASEDGLALSDDNEAIASALWRSTQESKDSQALRDHIHAVEGRDWLRTMDLEPLGQWNDERSVELLLGSAFAVHPGEPFTSRQWTAIMALSRTQPTTAMDACVMALQNAKRGAEYVPGLLVRLNSQAAIAPLLDHLRTAPNSLQRFAIGRALREAPIRDVESALSKLIQDNDGDVRAAAAEAAGWMMPTCNPFDLELVATNDVDETVQRSAQNAIRRREDESVASTLLSTFKEKHGVARWGYLDAAIDLADPVLLLSRRDPLWVGAFISDDDFETWTYVDEKLEARRRRMKSDAEWRDRASR